MVPWLSPIIDCICICLSQVLVEPLRGHPFQDPIYRHILTSTIVSEFWVRRWNGLKGELVFWWPFHQALHQFCSYISHSQGQFLDKKFYMGFQLAQNVKIYASYIQTHLIIPVSIKCSDPISIFVCAQYMWFQQVLVYAGWWVVKYEMIEPFPHHWNEIEMNVIQFLSLYSFATVWYFLSSLVLNSYLHILYFFPLASWM